MQSNKLRHGIIAFLAISSVSLSTAAMSVAEPIGPGSGSDAAGCKMPGNGKTIDSGSTGTDSDGTVYSCTNGVGCQVEGGKVTTKCSHMNIVQAPPPPRRVYLGAVAAAHAAQVR
jgi:hypothetical protein